MSGHSPFSDSVRAVSGSTDRSAPVWDIPEVREIGEPLFGYDHWVNCVTGSPYDTRVAGDADAKRPVNEAADRRALGCAWRFSRNLYSVMPSLDAASPGTLKGSLTSCMAYYPDVSKLAAGADAFANGASISIWDTVNRRLIFPPIRGHDSVFAVLVPGRKTPCVGIQSWHPSILGDYDRTSRRGSS
ncbi:uncharacterized protein EDB91DRAFT_1079496 [Suillus paluster]|uniref:uncharacterized protein n=1 Tax=Suillus paluster TaxID=48578 RepID=UPI001B85F528|nr:uncharacterized protein EDB91DRAFT_1079496 [Suillus paluster]KAG1747774.1 hypothetical protein EDB91DRAFT_1079496 [Suillus paluster]